METLEVVLIVVCFGIYFLPAIIACVRDLRNAGSILMLNFFLGWTALGWVVALCWASAGTAEIRVKPARR